MYKIKVGLRRANLARTCSRRGPTPRSRAENGESPEAPKMVRLVTPLSLRQATALALVAVLLCPLHASAGVVIRGTQGITFTGADGIYYDNVSGVTFTGADALTYQVNGITGTSTTSGVTFTGADGNRV